MRRNWIKSSLGSRIVREAQLLLKAIEKEGLQGGEHDKSPVVRPRHIHAPGIQQERQVIHVYPCDDLAQRTAVREALAKDTARAQIPGGGEFIVAQEAEIMIPAPFMRPLGSQDYGSGNVYEMCIYTYEPGQIPKVLEAWATAIPDRRVRGIAGLRVADAAIMPTVVSGNTNAATIMIGERVADRVREQLRLAA